MNQIKNPVGRPRIIKDGRLVSVYLDKDTIAKVKKMGNGQVSSGIRLAVGAYEKAK